MVRCEGSGVGVNPNISVSSVILYALCAFLIRCFANVSQPYALGRKYYGGRYIRQGFPDPWRLPPVSVLCHASLPFVPATDVLFRSLPSPSRSSCSLNYPRPPSVAPSLSLSRDSLLSFIIFRSTPPIFPHHRLSLSRRAFARARPARHSLQTGTYIYYVHTHVHILYTLPKTFLEYL